MRNAITWKRADVAKDHAIAESMIQQIADNKAEDHTAHGAAEADEPGNRANQFARKQISRQNHDQRGPGLLAEERDAEQNEREVHGRVAHEQDAMA